MAKRLCARAPEQSGGRVDIVASGEVLFDSGGVSWTVRTNRWFIQT